MVWNMLSVTCSGSSRFLTYQGASITMRSVPFCDMFILFMFVFDTEPHMEQPFFQIDLMIEVYKSFLMLSGVGT
jgi:hypothetical protein